MTHIRKTQLLSLGLITGLVAGAVGLRASPVGAEWAPLFDIAALLGIFAVSFTWESERNPRA